MLMLKGLPTLPSYISSISKAKLIGVHGLFIKAGLKGTDAVKSLSNAISLKTC